VIGGASPLRGLSEATASRRQLHEVETDVMSPEAFAVRTCGMEAVDKPQHRTRVNPYAGWPALGECAFQHDARYPAVGGTVMGAGAAGHHPSLPQEISTGPRLRESGVSGSAYGGNDVRAKPVEKSDHPVVARKPGNAGGAKGVTG
jgi:hypothetical protein